MSLFGSGRSAPRRRAARALGWQPEEAVMLARVPPPVFLVALSALVALMVGPWGDRWWVLPVIGVLGAGFAGVNRVGVLAVNPGEAVLIRHRRFRNWRPERVERVTPDLARRWRWVRPTHLDGDRWWATTSTRQTIELLARPAAEPMPLPDDFDHWPDGAGANPRLAYRRSALATVASRWPSYAAIVTAGVATGLAGYLVAVAVIEAVWGYAVWTEPKPSEEARAGSVVVFWVWAALLAVPVYIAYAAMVRRALTHVAADQGRDRHGSVLGSARRSAWWGLPLLAVTAALLPFGIGVALTSRVALLPVLGLAGYPAPRTALQEFRSDPLRRHLVDGVATGFGAGLAVVALGVLLAMAVVLGLAGPGMVGTVGLIAVAVIGAAGAGVVAAIMAAATTWVWADHLER